jgi:hypothetical protein
MIKNMEDLKDTILDIVKGTLGKPIVLRTLIRAARAADSSFSYYSWDYGVALKLLEKEGLIRVERRRPRLVITQFKKGPGFGELN